MGTERWSKMKGKELAEICKNYADFEIEFIFTDGDNGIVYGVIAWQPLSKKYEPLSK